MSGVDWDQVAVRRPSDTQEGRDSESPTQPMVVYADAGYSEHHAEHAQITPGCLLSSSSLATFTFLLHLPLSLSLHSHSMGDVDVDGLFLLLPFLILLCLSLTTHHNFYSGGLGVGLRDTFYTRDTQLHQYQRFLTEHGNGSLQLFAALRLSDYAPASKPCTTHRR